VNNSSKKGENMYIDPGTGSVLLQVILAAVLGLGVFVKIFWKKIRSLFNKNQEVINDDSQTDFKNEGNQ
jgi:hypothetical protein